MSAVLFEADPLRARPGSVARSTTENGDAGGERYCERGGGGRGWGCSLHPMWGLNVPSLASPHLLAS